MLMREPGLGPSNWGRLWRDGWAPGFLFWCVFLLALEPGNLSRALQAGERLTWSGEGVRIAGAGLLGSAAAPVIAWLARRYPVGHKRPLHMTWHLAAVAVLAPTLVLTAHLLAAAFLDGPRFIAEAVARNLSSNLTLVAFGLLSFDGLLHAVVRPAPEPVRAAGLSPGPPLLKPAVPMFEVRSRGAVTRIAADEIDWIEAQGNYVALHVGAACHLIRETLASVEARLDPSTFVRAHRSALVSVPRVRSLRRLSSGDAVARLTDGREVRVSRTYAPTLRARLPSD